MLMLKNAGFEVSIKDCFAEKMDWESFREFISKERPDIVGLGGMSPVIDNVFRAIKLIRPYSRHIVLGGPHASLFGKAVFEQCPEVDFGIVGEGEGSFLDLAVALQAGRSTRGIAGVFTRDYEGPKRKELVDIDSLPFPDRGMVPQSRYKYPFSKGAVTTMFTSRGCPYCCTFCDKSTFGSRWRSRSAESVLEEIDEIINRHKIRSIIFYDDLFTVDKTRVAAICEGILRRGYQFEWKCEGRVNLADLEVMKLMKRAGCSMMAYGVESGNQHGLDYLNKGTTLAQIENAFYLTRKARIKTMAYFILGIPVETYQDGLNTIEFARKIKTDYAQFSILSPFFGTKIYEDAIKNGWYAEINAQNPMDKDLKRPVILSENWNEQQLQEILKIAHRRFYLRPSYIIQHALTISSFSQSRKYFKEFTKILSWLKT